MPRSQSGQFRYSPINNPPKHDLQDETQSDEERVEVLQDDDGNSPRKLHQAYQLCNVRRLTWLLAINILLFVSSGVFLWLAIKNLRKENGSGEVNYCLKETSAPSPVLNALEIPLITKIMNGSLISSSVWRALPSPEVDLAWSRISTRSPIAISRSDLLKLGKDPADAARFSPSFGFKEGEDYIAKVDVFHQIHCLNMLRMNLDQNYDYYHSKNERSVGGEGFGELHVTHCLQTLLENLMCTGNVDVYTHTWVDAQKLPYAEFGIQKKCRDFDAILAWQEEHSVSMERVLNAEDLGPPEGYKVHELSREEKAVLGIDEHSHS